MNLRKNYRSLKKYWILCFLFMVLLYIFTIFPFQNTFSYLNKMRYFYEISFSSTGSNWYEMYFPVIQEENGSISQVIDEMVVIGNCTIQINDTIKGNSIKILGTGLIELKIDSLKTNNGLPFLSLTNYSGHHPSYFFEHGIPLQVWIYSNQSNIRISCSFYYEYYFLNGYLSLNPLGTSTNWVHTLENVTSVGWNQMAFTISPIFID